MASVTYVYCLVRSARKPATSRVPPGLPGGERPAAADLNAGVWLVHAPVPLDRYDEEALETAMRDLEWVSRIALAHAAVVEYFATLPGAAVIPMKLFTMFSNLDRAHAEMGQRRRAIERVFARIEGCEEWGVRVLRGDAPAARKPVLRPATGAAFLAARKQVRDRSREALRAAAEAADQAYESLAEIAREDTRRADAPAGGAAPLLDAAFLVPVRRRTRFQSLAARLANEVARSGAQMTVTGPWPPYNFVTSDNGGGEA